MKNFRHYLAESEKQHFYAVKFASQPSEQQCGIVKNLLGKFGIVSISKAEPVLDPRIDFANTNSKDIWQILVVTNVAFSPYVLQQEIKAALGIPEDHVVVRNSNEPIQLYADEDEFDYVTNDMAAKDELVPAARLSTDRLYNVEEAPLLTDLFGNEYNRRLLDYLANVADSRPSAEYEPQAPLFSWIDMHKATDAEAVPDEDFNKGFDTPKPVGAKATNSKPIADINLGAHGQLDDMSIQNVKFMKDKTGKRKNFLAPRAGLKAEKER